MKSALFIILLAGFPPSAAAPANNSGLGEPPLKEHTGGGNALFRRFCYSSGFISTVR